MTKEPDLKQKLEHLPSDPGVYLFMGEQGEVLYVGKAKRLSNRVRSYFQKSASHGGKIRAMVRNIRNLEVIVTDSESEALILENNLIKKHRPRYNILYRDDKSYPYICVTQSDRPRVFPTRVILRDGSRYFGPYDHVGKMKAMLETIRQTFGLCTCACTPRMIDASRGVPQWGKCFEDYFENCSGGLALAEYQATLEQVVRLLEGRTGTLVRELREQMDAYAREMEFEKAALLRDGVIALQKYSEKMKVVSADGKDRDLFALEVHREQQVSCGVLLMIREGKLTGKYHRYMRNIEGVGQDTLIQSFMEDYYTGAHAGQLPDEVCVSHAPADDEPLLEYLWQAKGRKVAILRPERGEKAQQVRMAVANARLLLKEWILNRMKADQGRIPRSVQALQAELQLVQPPRRMECFDISNFQGTHTVASMVCFVDGKPRKSEYKRFHIKSVDGPDDFASMREVVTRRYSRLVSEKGTLPDLVIIDGGKGQLSSVTRALEQLHIPFQIPVIGLAKRLEEVFFPDNPSPLMLPRTSPGLMLLQRIRDEAHRVAVGFHRDVRSKHTFRSQLQDIPGVGQKTAEKLLRHFGSVQAVGSADEQELGKVVGAAKAGHILRYLSNS